MISAPIGFSAVPSRELPRPTVRPDKAPFKAQARAGSVLWGRSGAVPRPSCTKLPPNGSIKIPDAARQINSFLRIARAGVLCLRGCGQRGDPADRREEPHGSEFWHCRHGLAAAGQLGSAARIPHRASARDDEEAWPRRPALHVRRERALHHRHADSGLESAQARTALRHVVRRRRARSCSSRATSASRSSATSPWIPKENVRHSFAWIKGAAGPASTQQVTKFTKAVMQAMKENGVAGRKARRRFRRHQHDQHLQGEQHQLVRRHDADDGSARGQERGRAGVLPHRWRHRRRYALGVHEIPATRQSPRIR